MVWLTTWLASIFINIVMILFLVRKIEKVGLEITYLDLAYLFGLCIVVAPLLTVSMISVIIGGALHNKLCKLHNKLCNLNMISKVVYKFK